MSNTDHQSPLHVTSEIGALQTVLVHRPGKELENLTPDHLRHLLFDDIPYLKVAQQEHDIFVERLTERGVEVLYLERLLVEALSDSSVKEQFINDVLSQSKQEDRSTAGRLHDYLAEQDAQDVALNVISGIRKQDVALGDGSAHLHELVRDLYPFWLDPMPNLYFTRDIAAVIGDGITINKMRFSSRRRESLLMKYIIENHPRFKNHSIPTWYDRDSAYSLEGGDVLVLNDSVVAIGISQRTTAEAIELMASTFLARSGFRYVVAIEIPKAHAFMHLDTVLTMIDVGTFTIHPRIKDAADKMNVFILSLDDRGQVAIEQSESLDDVLKKVLGLDEITLIPTGGNDPIASAREQWNDGSNTLALAPGVVMTYDRNYVSNDLLRDHGIDVVEVPGSELGRGRGGPRCMSMPLIREDLA